MEFFEQAVKVQFVPEPGPIPALAGPGTPRLGLPSSRSYGQGFTPGIPALRPCEASYAVQNRSGRFCQPSPAPHRTCPQPSSGL